MKFQRKCSCGCGQLAMQGNRFIHGHNKPRQGGKNPILSKWLIENQPMKRPEQIERMRKNNPMKRPDVALKVSMAQTGKKRPWVSERMKALKGEKNSNWQGGRSFEPYGIDFNQELKDQIRKRDNYQCQECGYLQEDLGYRLDVHHIDYDKGNNIPANLISLCRSCHAQTNFKREDWTEYYQGKLEGICQ